MSKRSPLTDLLLNKRWRIKENTRSQYTLFIDLPALGYLANESDIQDQLKKEIIRAIKETNIYKHNYHKNEL